MPRELTILPGVKIVFEEDCDECIRLHNDNIELSKSNDDMQRVIQELNSWSLKVVGNAWDKGYNQCIMDMKRRLYQWSQDF